MRTKIMKIYGFGAANAEICLFLCMIYSSPYGTIELTATPCGLTSLHLCDAKRTSDCNVPSEALRWLDIYFSGNVPDFLPPLNLDGVSDFARRVYEATLQVPFGQTATYGEIAHRIGCRSPRAVGQALHRNPIWLIIPCHRIIGANGSLTGYAGGNSLKSRLLTHESIEI